MRHKTIIDRDDIVEYLGSDIETPRNINIDHMVFDNEKNRVVIYWT